MTDAFAPPSADPGNLGSLAGLLRQMGEKLTQNLDDCLPCRVVSFDRAANRVQVQPLVMMVTTEGQPVERAPLASIPVFRLGVGDGFLYFPIKPGDLGWLKASDRDISLVLQSWGQSTPNTRRMHSFQDAVFLPDSMRTANPEGDDADRINIAWKDGTRVTIGEGDIKAVAAAGLRVTGNVFIDGNLGVSTGATGSVSTGTGRILTIENGVVTNIT